MSAGIGVTPGAGVNSAVVGETLPKVRLFVSPVKDLKSQPGPLVVPLVTPTRGITVDPLLNTAWLSFPLPKTLNSAWCQLLLKSGKRLSPGEEPPLPPTKSVSVSVGPSTPAVEPSTSICGSISAVADEMGVELPTML